MSGEQTPREERLRQFDELVASGDNGVKGVGWPTRTWGMITGFSRIHELFEEIMQRPVWTHEMGTTGLKLMREELEHDMEPLNPIESLKRVAPHAKVIPIIVPDEDKKEAS